MADISSKIAILIDPVLEHAERDAELVKQLGFSLKYVSESVLSLYTKIRNKLTISWSEGSGRENDVSVSNDFLSAVWHHLIERACGSVA